MTASHLCLNGHAQAIDYFILFLVFGQIKLTYLLTYLLCLSIYLSNSFSLFVRWLQINLDPTFFNHGVIF